MSRTRSLVVDPDARLANLRRMLALEGWTQTELAKRSGLATAYVNQLLTGRKKSPTLDVLDAIAAAFAVSTSVLIDRRLSDNELRTELSQGALRAATAAGISHPKFPLFVRTDEAPVSVEEWERLARLLEIAETPIATRSPARPHRSKESERR